MTFIVIGGSGMDVFFESMSRLPVGTAGTNEFTSESLAHVSAPPVFTIGGNAGNTATALARLGGAVRLVSSWADDIPGRHVQDWLDSCGCESVNVHGASSTSVNVTATADDRSRVTFFHGPAFATGSGAPLLAAARPRVGDVVLLTGYPHPAVSDLAVIARGARDAGARVALDIGPATAGLELVALAPLLPSLDLLLGNEREIEGLDPGASLDEIVDRLVRATSLEVVVKRGRAGARFRSARARSDVPASIVDGRTTVGAGDVFDAGFLHAWVTDADPADALRFACAAASAMLERGEGPGSTPHASIVEASLVTERKVSPR